MKGLPKNVAPGESWRGIWIPVVVVLLWCGFQVARDPGFFWHDDFQAYYSPVFEEIVRAWRSGEWPLLSASTWCAGNLAGEFQNGTFSPPFNALLVAIWALPLSLSLKAAALATAHLVWLAMGVFMLGRLRGLTPPLATAAALATSLSGWIIGWAATDWITFLTGFSWVPWVWWTLQIAIQSDSTWKRWLRPGLCVALLITEGNAFAAVEIAMIALWLAVQAITTARDWRALGPLAAAGLIGTGLSAPAWWLLIEMLQSSPRGEWGSVVHVSWSVPWTAWPGLILPSFVTTWRQFGTTVAPQSCLELACGIVPVAALAAALFSSPLATFRKLRWELVLLALCILLVSLPSIGQFRWSFRWLPLFHLVLALAALSAWQEGLARRAPAWAVGLTVAAWATAAFLGNHGNSILAVSFVGLGILWWLAERHARRTLAEAAPAGIIAVSLGLTFALLPTNPAQPKYAFTETIRQPAPLDPTRLYLSLYSAGEIAMASERPPGFGSLLRPANAMLYAHLRFLNGYSAFGGREVKALFDSHGAVESAKAESLAGPDGERLLYFLGVDGIVFSHEYLPFAEKLGPEWEKVTETTEGTVYHRTPRRFTPVKALGFLFDRPGVPLAKPDLEVITERGNSVSVRVTAAPLLAANPDSGLPEPAPGRTIAPIAFVRPYLAGYHALFDGKPVPVREYRGILPIVELPGNASGVLELRYRPAGLTAGGFVAGSTAFVMLLIGLAGAFGKLGDPARHVAAAPGAPLGKAKFLALYAVFLFVLAVFLAGATEAVLRLAGRKPWESRSHPIRVGPGGQFYAPQPELGYSHLPGKFTVTHETGHAFTATHLPDTLRTTHPIEDAPDAGEKDGLWIFGCSFTHGWSLNDAQTYPWLLQERFPAMEVRNFGVGGYGTLQSLLQFREALKTSTPKVAVLAYADFHDERNTFPRARRKEVVPWNRLGPLAQPFARLNGNGGLTYSSANAEYAEFPLMRRSALAHAIEISYDRLESALIQSHRVTELLIVEMANLAREHGVKFVLARIHGGAPMQQFAENHGISYVDIAVDLSQPKNTNLPHDGHPSAIANQCYAEKLGGFLESIVSIDR